MAEMSAVQFDWCIDKRYCRKQTLRVVGDLVVCCRDALCSNIHVCIAVIIWLILIAAGSFLILFLFAFYFGGCHQPLVSCLLSYEFSKKVFVS